MLEKKAVFAIESINVQPGAVSLDAQLDTTKIVTINPPSNMAATRCTIQLIGCGIGDKLGTVCISSQIPINGFGGYILQNTNDAILGTAVPTQWTFENFNGHAWSQSIYLAAINLHSGQPARLIIIWEGDKL